MQNNVLVMPMSGRERVVEALKREGKRVLEDRKKRVSISLAVCKVKEGDWGDLLLIQSYLEKYQQVMVIKEREEQVPLKLEGWKWTRCWIGGLSGWKLQKRKQEEQGPGDWTMPKPRWVEERKRFEGWRPRTFVKVEELKKIPGELLDKVKVRLDPDLPWYQQRLGSYFPFMVDDKGRGIVVEETMTGRQLIQTCPESESFLIEISGWPLKHVPLKYLRWLVGDLAVRDQEGRYRKKTEKNLPPGETVVDGGWFLKKGDWVFQPCDRILYKKIIEFLDLPENREEFQPFKEDTESNGFYGTGCWVSGDTAKEVYAWLDKTEKDAAGAVIKKCFTYGQDRVQRFLDLGTSKPNKWSWTGLTRLQVQEHSWDQEDPDPDPSGVEHGLKSWEREHGWTDHSRWVLSNEKPKWMQRVKSEYGAWVSLLEITKWSDVQYWSWLRRAWRKKWGLNPGEEEEFWVEYQEVKDRMGFYLGKMEEVEAELQEGEADMAWKGLQRLQEALEAWDGTREHPEEEDASLELSELLERVALEARHEKAVRPRRKAWKWSREKAWRLSMRTAKRQQEGPSRRKILIPVVINDQVEFVPQWETSA